MSQKDSTLGILTDKVGRLACSKCGEELDVSEYSIFEHVLCPVCQNEVSVPAKLGNFFLIDEIGRGGMGAVYLARDESLGREVALKVMRQEYGSDPRFLDNLLKEAQAAASLNHPNIVQVYTFGQEMGQPFIVMELVNGGRLDLHIKQQNQVDELTVIDTALDVAKGLQAAAEAGLIHGDIKPANILYDRQNHAKVVDFGLAKFEGGGKTKGEIWGTPYYIAPEKARSKGEDSRSDQYSLGATLYHALAGKPPFDGETAADVVVARLKNPPPDVRQTNAKVTDKTAALVLRMMDPTPSRRYPTYPSLLADLQEARTTLLSIRQQQQLAAKGKGKALASQKASSNRLIWTLVSLGILGAVAAGIALSKKKSSQGATLPGNSGASLASTAVPKNFWPTHQINDSSPFSQSESAVLLNSVRIITDAIRKGEPTRSLGAQAKLGPVLAKHQAGSPALAWCQLYQVMIHVLANESDLAKDLLKDLINSKIIYVGSPVEDPRVLAKLIAGQVQYANVKANTTQAAHWFRQLVDFFGAFRMVLEGDPLQVPTTVQAYAVTGNDFYWPYAFQDFANLIFVQASELNGILAGKDDARKSEALAAFGAKSPLWKNALRKAGGTVGVSRGTLTYIEIIREAKPLVYYRLNDAAPGKLSPFVDADQCATAVYVVADGLGKATTSLAIKEGFEEGNRVLTLAGRNNYDYVNNLVAVGKMTSRAGSVVFWFRTKEPGPREMFFARGNEGTPFRVRLDKDGKPEFSVGEGTPKFRISLEAGFADGKWHQMAASWSAPENRAELAVDGTLVSGRYALPDFAFDLTQFGRSEVGAGLYKGDIDEIALWNRALTPAEFALLTSR